MLRQNSCFVWGPRPPSRAAPSLGDALAGKEFSEGASYQGSVASYDTCRKTKIPPLLTYEKHFQNISTNVGFGIGRNIH